LNEDVTLRPHAQACQAHAPAWQHARHTPTIGAFRLPRDLAMRPAHLSICALALFTVDVPAAPLPSAADLAAAVTEVKAAETAFAKTMADRRLDLFTDFVAEDAVFVGSAMNIGRASVIQSWSAFFKGAQAPFSWAPDAVAVAADGRTAVSTGLAHAPGGKIVSRFTSLWRKDPDGHWRVIADQGVDAGTCVDDKK
jgi:ketosteroid isomerase-like protein